jgi:hypothetical protein
MVRRRRSIHCHSRIGRRCFTLVSALLTSSQIQ